MSGSIIAVLPYYAGLRLDFWNVPLEDLEYPLGRPNHLFGKNKSIKHLSKTDHLIVYPRRKYFTFLKRFCKAQISLMIVEPDSIHQKYFHWTKRAPDRFFTVLTKNKDMLATHPRAKKLVFGTTFIDDPSTIDISKSKRCSIVSSAKQSLPGHKMRHRIVDQIRQLKLDVDILGRGYKPFDKKEEGIAPYEYSVVIENSREIGYFSEKLVDCFLCGTVPIYWGALDIEDYFDTRGMIVCETEEDIVKAVNDLDGFNLKEKGSIIAANRDKAFHYADLSGRAAKVVHAAINDEAS